MHSLPDVLVLGAGGVLAEAWLSGVVAGIEDATGRDLRDCESFLGTSAGAIVSSRLASGRRTRRPTRASRSAALALRDAGAQTPDRSADQGAEGAWSLATFAALSAGRAAVAAGRPILPVALRAGTPAGALARSLLLRAMPEGTRTLANVRAQVRRWGSGFDGRLRVVAVDRAQGNRVVFGSPGAPEATVAEAVAASCAIPGVFEPVAIGGREYVDGGLWSPTNLDAAPAGLATHVLCLNPMASLQDGSLAAVRTFARTAAAVEQQALRARGAAVTVVAPDRLVAAAIGRNPMDAGPRDVVLAAGHLQGLELAARGAAW